MANLKKLKDPTMASAACKKHRKHQQSLGVCAVCLTEKLSKLANKTSKSSWRRSMTMVDSSSSSASSSSSSYHSSSASSSSSSPMHGFRHLTTTTLYRAKTQLTESRSSMPFFPRFRGKDEGSEHKSKGGIWSNFLRLSRTKQTRENLKPNKTVRERVDGIIITH